MTSNLKMDSISTFNRQEIDKGHDDYVKNSKSIRLDKNVNKFEKMMSNINEKKNCKDNDSSSDSEEGKNLIINSKNRNVGKIKNLIK